MSRNEKLWGLALTAAIQIVSHDECAVSIHASTATRHGGDPVSLLREIIYDTMAMGLSFGEGGE